MSHCCGHQADCCSSGQLKRGDGLFATLFKLALLYVVLVFGAGTLIHTGHPVAKEVGKLVQVVTLVDPAIHWASAHHWDHVAGGLRALANGMPLG